MTQGKVSVLFDNLPIDLQKEIYGKILFPQSNELLKEINETRLSHLYRDTLKILGEKSAKKVGLTLKETQTVLIRRGMPQLAEKMGRVCEDIYLKMNQDQ